MTAYLASRGTPHTVTDLKQHNCLGYALAEAGSDRWVMGPRSEISVPISGNLRANNGDALLAAAISGQGIVQQPTLEHPSTEQLAVHAIYLPDRHPPAKVRAFIDFLAREFAPGRPGIAASPRAPAALCDNGKADCARSKR